MNANACPVCKAPVSTVREPREIRIGRRSALVDDEFQRCGHCGNEFYFPAQMRATQVRAAERIREQLGLISPERIRLLRSRLRLTQHQLEKALDVGPKTVVRWERGTVLPSKTANRLLHLLEKSPHMLGQLGSLGGFLPQHGGSYYEAWIAMVGTSVAFASTSPWSTGSFSHVLQPTPTPSPRENETTIVLGRGRQTESAADLENAA
jgi:HTH-type transcriptional regulator / antitoxin MqsA